MAGIIDVKNNQHSIRYISMSNRPQPTILDFSLDIEDSIILFKQSNIKIIQFTQKKKKKKKI